MPTRSVVQRAVCHQPGDPGRSTGDQLSPDPVGLGSHSAPCHRLCFCKQEGDIVVALTVTTQPAGSGDIWEGLLGEYRTKYSF